MKINIILTKNEVASLDALIDINISFGLDKSFFITGDQDFLEEHRHIVQNRFQRNGIVNWYPEGCGKVKFKFTELGLGLIKKYKPDVFKELKQFLPFSYPPISPEHLPVVNFEIS